MNKLQSFFFVLSSLLIAQTVMASDSENDNATTTHKTTNFIKNVQAVKDIYGQIIEALREGGRLGRSDIIKAYEADPFLKKESTKDGHAKFSCALTGHTFCVVAHSTNDIRSIDEKRGHHRAIQTYVNVLTNFVNTNQGLTPQSFWDIVQKSDWNSRRQEEESRYDSYSHTPTKQKLARRDKNNNAS